MPRDLAKTLTSHDLALNEAHAVVLPDLFIDCLVPLEDRAGFAKGMDRIVRQGGGNLITPNQRLHLGGNAANTAKTLAALGVPTTLIAATNPTGETLFEQATDGLPITLHTLHTTQDPSTTVALELDTEDANVMLSNPGPLASLGPGDLDETAWDLIENADVAAITNWSQTIAYGTELLAHVLPRAKRAGAATFLDTGDPSHRGADVHDLLHEPSLQRHLDAWAMNDHEARTFASALTGEPREGLDEHDAARALDEHVHARIDVHTATEAFSRNEGDNARAETFPIIPAHLTGAGDAWNAGTILGMLLDLPAPERLTLANAAAAFTITRPRHAPPSLADIAGFLEAM